ncbi:signal peptidase II [Aureimonas altamirensis]|uniref:signal peptidase II n=1 Tax=Aureimonas altamirensis TaxID=370622 RepID=UPI0020368EBA|nr:signal peptidase II [Aureimonas altamirensis]MCM2505690.1 signal peptidase II [Aureimonas altamirensis]
MRHVQLFVVILAAFAADQISKAAALVLLGLGTPVAVFPGLNFTLGFNEGVSFGMLSGIMEGRPLTLAAITSAITVWFAFIAVRSSIGLERFGFALIVGGSLGNIFDRLRQGAVTDFLDINWSNWRWPTFNIADVAIVVGAVAVLASLWLGRARTMGTTSVASEAETAVPNRTDIPSS